MNLIFHAIALWSGTAAAALVSATWQGLVLALGIALWLRLLPGASAAGRSLLWMIGYFLVVLLHFSPIVQQHASHSGLGYTSAVRMNPLWGFAVTAMWILLSTYRAVQLAGSAWSLRRIARRAVPTTCDEGCMALLKSVRRPVQLCLSRDVDRPSVIGFRFPRILLPPALLAELSSSELKQVILHEMEHLRRADDWTNLVQKLVLVFFPLNPVLLWIEHRLSTERELACDDGVLRQTRARKAYASCLTRLAEHSIVRHGATLALGAWERQSELSRRVYRILRQPETAFTVRQGRWVTGLLTLVLLTGAGELARSPQLIRFAPQSELATLVSASLPQATAHMVLAKAIMPSVPNHAAPVHHQARRAVLTRSVHDLIPSLREVSARPIRPHSPWVVLTSFTQPYGSRSLAIQSDISPAYAAVPVEDGWLIIQL